jgi:hypothetical protein
LYEVLLQDVRRSQTLQTRHERPGFTAIFQPGEHP